MYILNRINSIVFSFKHLSLFFEGLILFILYIIEPRRKHDHTLFSFQTRDEMVILSWNVSLNYEFGPLAIPLPFHYGRCPVLAWLFSLILKFRFILVHFKFYMVRWRRKESTRVTTVQSALFQNLVCKHYSSFSMYPKNSQLLIVNHHEENTNSSYAVIRHYFIATWNTIWHWMRFKWYSYFEIKGPFRMKSTISKLRTKGIVYSKELNVHQ